MLGNKLANVWKMQGNVIINYAIHTISTIYTNTSVYVYYLWDTPTTRGINKINIPTNLYNRCIECVVITHVK